MTLALTHLRGDFGGLGFFLAFSLGPPSKGSLARSGLGLAHGPLAKLTPLHMTKINRIATH